MVNSFCSLCWRRAKTIPTPILKVCMKPAVLNVTSWWCTCPSDVIYLSCSSQSWSKTTRAFFATRLKAMLQKEDRVAHAVQSRERGGWHSLQLPCRCIQSFWCTFYIVFIYKGMILLQCVYLARVILPCVYFSISVSCWVVVCVCMWIVAIIEWNPISVGNLQVHARMLKSECMYALHAYI